MARTDLISNPVFQAIQSPLQEGAETKSEILYANKFSGLDEVPMQNELLELFTSNNLNLTDTNFRLQLQHILEEYDSENGPWYIDGHNEVIHIHNRKIAPSSHVYRYQDENGEVLRVQITTNWTTGTTSGTVASVVSRNKVRDITRLDLPALDMTVPEADIESSIPRLSSIWLDTDMVGSNIPSYEPTMYRLTHLDAEGREVYDGVATAARASDHQRAGGRITPMPSSRDRMLIQQREWQEWQDGNREILDAHSRGEDRSKRNNLTYFDSLVDRDNDDIDKWHEKIIDDARKSVNTPEMAKMVDIVYKKIYNGEALTPAEQELANRNIYLENPEMAATFGKVRSVRNFTQTFKNEYNNGGYGAATWNTTYGTPGQTITALTVQDLEKELIKRGVSANASNNSLGGGTTHGPNTYVRESVNSVVQYARSQSEQNGGGSVTIGKISVTINNNGTYTVKVVSAGTYSPVISLMDYANFRARRDTPGVGGSKRAKAMALVNAMKNRAKKAKHKEIEVQMVVIGRPSLEAGQYLDILNIGQKYSGQWYVKTCIHQMDSNGYTCSLTLKRNQNTPSGSAVSVSRSPDGNVQGSLLPVETGEGIIYLSAPDLSYAHDQILRGNDRTAKRFLRTALYAQQQGTYGQGLKRVTNLGDIRMNGSENPELQYADTQEGQAATQAYNQAVQARRIINQASSSRLNLRRKK